MKHLLIFSIFCGLAIGSNEFKTNWGYIKVNLRPYLNWATGNEVQYTAKGNVYWYNADSNTTSMKIDKDEKKKWFGSKVNSTKFLAFDDSKTMKLFANDMERPNFWQQKAVYHIVDGNGAVTKIEPYNSTEKLQLFKFVPGSTNFVYVLKNNLYIRKFPAKNVSSSTVQLTVDGTDNLLNGVTSRMMKLSLTMEKDEPIYIDSTGSSMAFGQYDMSAFKYHFILMHGNSDKKNLFPTLLREKMGKAGAPNIPSPKLLAIENLNQAFTNQKSIVINEVTPPSAIGKSYLWENVKWINQRELHVDWINRPHTKKIKTICKKVAGQKKFSCDTRSTIDFGQSNGYVSSIAYDENQPLFTANGHYAFEIQDYKASGSNWTYHQIARIRLAGEPSKDFITTDNFPISTLKSYDEVNDILYFEGFGKEMKRDGGTAAMHLYKVTPATGTGNPVTTCISCTMIMPKTTNQLCLYNGIAFSLNSKYYIQRCSGPPAVVGVYLRLSSTNKIVRTIDENLAFKKKLAKSEFFPRRRVTNTKITSQETGRKYNVPYMIRFPNGYDQTTRYPIAVYSYNGPRELVSLDIANPTSRMAGFMDYLAMEHKVASISIDGRGTRGQSQEYKYEEHGKLGIPGADDQITVLNAFIANNKYFKVDGSRTAMVGHSLGGYLTLMTLIRDTKDVIKCGVAINPITSWRLAYPQFGEIYIGMDTKDGNSKGYDDTSIIKNHEKLRGKKFMIGSATADRMTTNHMVNILINNLETKDINFDYLPLIDDGHLVKKHQGFSYMKIFKFLAQPSCLNLSTKF